jgi:WD40 repeat protein
MPRPERPVDPAKGAIQEFAVALRELREQAGGPTYRCLADRTGLSISTLADAAGGRRLPTFAVAVAYAVACGGDEQEWAARWRAAAAEEMSPERAPYRGMAGFRGEDADLFFGRDRLVAELADRVREFPVTVVLGASGAGKSSLLAAGLVPALTELRPVVMTPGEHPAENLPRLDDTTVLVIDQFEELYTLCGAGERAKFLDDVLGRPDLRVVVSVRADYYGHCAEHPDLAEALRTNQVLVGPMTEDELRDAMNCPAAAFGLSVERALMATALQEAKGRVGVLPLLSHAMLETWRRRRGSVLTLAGFHAAGGIDGAVVRTAEEVYGALDPGQRELAAELLLRMLSIDESVTRRRVDLADVRSVDPGAGTVIDRLADARLVTVGGGTVEIAHDAMLTAWPRLGAWIDDHRDAVRAHRKISEAARIWVESDRDPSVLASGARLALMKAHSSVLAGVLRLSQVEKDFLQHSDTQARWVETAARRRTMRQRLLVAAAVVAVVVAAVFAGAADDARTDADAARGTALSQQAASATEKLRVTDPAVAAQLAIAGYRIEPTSEARSALLDSSAAPVPARYLGVGSAALAAAPQGGLVAVSDATTGKVTLLRQSAHGLARVGAITPEPPDEGRPVSSGAKVYALTFFPDGKTLAVADTSGAISLWRVSEPREPERITKLESDDMSGPVEQLAVNPTGKELAAVSGTRVLRWALDSIALPEGPMILMAPARVRSVAYSPAGGLLAYGTEAGEVHVWSGTTKRVIQARGRPAPTVAFAPDGRLFVGGYTSQVWDLSSWSIIAQPERLADVVVTMATFSPLGRHLIAGGLDSTIYVLDTRTWILVRTLAHPDVVTGVTLTAGGRAIVTVAADGAARWWDLRTVLPPRARGAVTETRFSADGTRLAVFAEGDISLWDTKNSGDPAPLAQDLTGGFSGAGDISRDGRWLAAGTDEGEVHLFDLTDVAHPRRVDVLHGLTGKVEALAFSEDGSTLVAGGEDTSVVLWDLTASDMPVSVFGTPGDVVLDLSWRPGGNELAVASEDGIVYLVDVSDADKPREKSRFDASSVYSAAFSLDGQLLATGGARGLVQLWDVRDPADPRLVGSSLTGPTGRVLGLSFHPTKKVLAASAMDGTVWLWNVADPARPARAAVLADAVSGLNTAVFRPVGDLLVAGGEDRVVHTWHTDERAVIKDICASVGERITSREWRIQLPDAPFEPPCR